MTKEELDLFESTLEQGLVRLCSSAGMLTEMLSSPDIDAKWDECIKDYTADAVQNFNQWPDAAIGFAAYLGMGVAHRWDKAWDVLCKEPYQSYYGPRGFDDMDDHICADLLHLSPEQTRKTSDLLLSCSMAALQLLRRSGIEAQTADGFYALVRCYGVMYRLGAAIELYRLGYRKVAVSPAHHASK